MKRVYDGSGTLYLAESKAALCEEHGLLPSEVRWCRWDETVVLQFDEDDPKPETLTMRQLVARYPVGPFIPEGP